MTKYYNKISNINNIYNNNLTEHMKNDTDDSGYSDIDEDLGDMVYVTPRSITLKKNKKKIIKEYFLESYKIPSNLIKNLEVNIDYKDSKECPYNISINNFFIKPSLNGEELEVFFPKLKKKFIWNDTLNRYFLNRDIYGDYIIFYQKGDTEYDYKGIYKKSNNEFKIKVNRLDKLEKISNSNYLFHIDNDYKNKYQAQFKGGSLFIQFPYNNDINKLGPFIINKKYNFPVYQGKSHNLKDYNLYFTKKNGKYCGTFLGRKIYLEENNNIYNFKGLFNILLFCISMYLFINDENKQILTFLLAYFYPIFYIIFYLVINFYK